MSNPTKNVMLRALIDAAITELYPQTTAEQILLTQDTTLAAKVAEMVAAINTRAKIEYVDAKIAGLINGAPTTLDTLKEIADAMATNDNVVTALEAAIGSKANQSDFSAHTNDTTLHITSTERTNWNDANSKKHSHSNKAILDATTASFTTAEKQKLASLTVGSTNTANTLSGLTATVTELNYMDGVTSNVQAQINALQNAINAINRALPYTVTINDTNKTINFADR